MTRFTVVVTDSPLPSLDIERSVLGAVGAELVALHATREEDLLEAVTEADGLLVGYAPVTQRVIDRAVRCRVIAREVSASTTSISRRPPPAGSS